MGDFSYLFIVGSGTALGIRCLSRSIIDITQPLDSTQPARKIDSISYRTKEGELGTSMSCFMNCRKSSFSCIS